MMIISKTPKLLFWGLALALLLVSTTPLPTPIDSSSSPSLLINELLASNGTGLTDEDGDFSDWLEIYNPTSQSVNLAGWSLTDEPDQPQKWLFPDITLKSQAYMVIFASGKNRSASPPLHTNFKLSRTGEFLGLYSILDGRFVDIITPAFPQQQPDVTCGRYGEGGTLGYLATATPGAPNETTLLGTGIASPVIFSPARGFYETAIQVELKSDIPGVTIRFTTDGSEPTDTHGELYNGPVSIEETTLLRAIASKPGLLPSPVNTHSYIFLAQVIAQPAQPPGWPGTWGVYLDYRPGLPPKGAPVPADYEMDPRITQDPKFGPMLKEGLKALPSISLVTEVKNFDIYINALERGEAWERPVSLEFINPEDHRQDFQINTGVRMQGVSNRWEFMPKKSFRLFFNGQYGATQLQYPLFPGSPIQQFDTLILRGGANRSYAGYIDAIDHTQATYARDEWLRTSQLAMSGVGSHGRFVHLYLNGLYWGLYNLVERPDASFAAAYLGGDKEDWFSAKHGGTILNPEEVAQGQAPRIMYREENGGSNERFERLVALARQDLSVPKAYTAIQAYLNLPQFSDYVILNLYSGNRDWNDNNWYAAMRNNPPGPLHYFIWDGELTWDEGARLYLGKTSAHHYIRPFFLALMKNADFRLLFADRVYKHLFNEGALTDTNAQARWLALTEPIRPAIVGESARWGDARYTDDPIDPDDWLRARQNVMDQMAGNGAKLITLLREAGYYPPLDPPTFNPPGGQIVPGFALTLGLNSSLPAHRKGVIYYTLDGSDPRKASSGAIAATAKAYTTPLILDATTLVKARTVQGETWSALHEATFHMGSIQPQPQITEVMYNPPEGDDYEFIELKNGGQADLDLSNLTFEGINFTFPPKSEPLRPGQSIVLVHNALAFAARYPEVTISGIYQGRLSNKGETLTLKDTTGNLLLSLTYDDENGWPVSPDGRGDSLVLVEPQGDPNAPKSWRASGQQGGSPGKDEVFQW
jgi:hypothetical protein